MTNYLSKYSRGLGFVDETSTPAERSDKYHQALGEFLSTFASVEAAMHLTLWHYAKTKFPIARAVFSGFKISDQIGLIKRLADVRRLSDEVKTELGDLFQQLGIINSARNDILHYGLTTVEGNAVISNFLIAIDESRLREFPISVASLTDMRHDCVKILVTLHSRHMGPKFRLGKAPGVKETMREPWRYKHAPMQPPKPHRQIAKEKRS